MCPYPLAATRGGLGQGGAAYYPTALYASRVASWHLDEVSGSRADSVGANTLTDNNTAGSRAGIIYPLAADFIRANNEYLSIADNAAVSLGNVDFWGLAYYYADDPINGQNYCIMSKYDQSGQREWALAHIESGHYLRLYYSQDGGTNLTLDTTAIPYLGNWHMGLFWYDSTADLLYLQLNNATPVSVANSFGAINGASAFRIGSMKNLTSFDFDGAISNVAIGKNYLPTAADRAYLWSLISGTARIYWNQVTCEGDSQTSGYGLSAGQDYPSQLDVLLPATDIVTNVGAASNTLNDMTNQAAATDATKKFGYRNILVIWGGTNDMYGGQSGASTYTEFVTYCQARQTAGWTVIALTCLPRSGAATPANFETQRTAFNTPIRANWATFATALVDIAADNRIGDSGDELDMTYYQSDNTHLTQAGYAIVAAAVKAAIDAL